MVSDCCQGLLQIKWSCSTETEKEGKKTVAFLRLEINSLFALSAGKALVTLINILVKRPYILRINFGFLENISGEDLFKAFAKL